MSQREAWEAYFYPETIDPSSGNGILKNLLHERDPFVLRVLEYGSTTDRQAELMAGGVDIARTFDAEHMRAIHKHLFQDVYSWAGQYRTVDMSKGGTPGGFASTAGEIDRYLSDVHTMVNGADWAGMDHETFARSAAKVFAYVNQAHPFREGNGRTAKVFMEHVAELSGFTFDYARVSPTQWNEAARWSGPDLGAYTPYVDELVPVFRAIAIERAPAPESAPAVDEVTRQRSSLLAASFPKPAQQATRGQGVGATSARTAPYLPGRGRETPGRSEGR